MATNSVDHDHPGASEDVPVALPGVGSAVVYAPLSAMIDIARRGEHPLAETSFNGREKAPCLTYLHRNAKPQTLDFALDVFMIERMGTYVDPVSLVHSLHVNGHPLSLYDLVEYIRSRFPFGAQDGVHLPYVILTPLRPHGLSFSVRTPYILLPSFDSSLLHKIAHDISWAKPFLPEKPSLYGSANGSEPPDVSANTKKKLKDALRDDPRDGAKNGGHDNPMSSSSFADVFAEWVDNFEDPEILRMLFNNAGGPLSPGAIADRLKMQVGSSARTAAEISACLGRMLERQSALHTFSTPGVIRGNGEALTLETTDQPFFLRSSGHGLYVLMILPRNMPARKNASTGNGGGGAGSTRKPALDRRSSSL